MYVSILFLTQGQKGERGHVGEPGAAGTKGDKGDIGVTGPFVSIKGVLYHKNVSLQDYYKC